MTYRKRKFFVQLIVNFNEIQHYTWLGTFWNYVYKYTFIYTAPGLHLFFFLYLIIDQLLSTTLSLLLYSSFVFINKIVLRHLLLFPIPFLDYHLTGFLRNTYVISTRFSYKCLYDCYQIFLHLLPFH